MRKNCGNAVQCLLASVCIAGQLSPARPEALIAGVRKPAGYTPIGTLFVLSFTHPSFRQFTSVISRFYTVSTAPTIKFCQ